MIILMLAILVVCYMLLAGVVVYGNLKRTANVLFGAILLCFAVWSLGMVVFIGGTDEVFVRAGAALFYLAATCFAPLLLVFALHYSRKKHVRGPRSWESSMSSDIMFEPELQRCICVDIRYVLFIVDKFGGQATF